jgi:hypothetical protein
VGALLRGPASALSPRQPRWRAKAPSAHDAARPPARRWALPLAQFRAAAAAREAEGLQLVLHYGDLVDVVGEGEEERGGWGEGAGWVFDWMAP